MNNDLELYKIFYIVATIGNISQAAESLYISQPAVSKSIKKLENITGINLFLRNSRGVKLTNEGVILFEYVQRAMKEISVGEELMSRIKKREHGIIKLGVSTTLCKYYLIPHLKEFMTKYPHIQIKIVNKTSSETLKLVEEGIIDFGLISRPFDCKEYNFIELADIQDIFVASKEYLKAYDLEKYMDILSNGNLMLLESDNITRKYIDRYFAEHDINIDSELEMNNMDLLIELAKIGLGVTAVIKDIISIELEHGELIEIPVNPKIPKRTIGIISHKKIPLSIASETFVRFLEQKFKWTPKETT